MTAMRYRMLCIDLDGTLTGSPGQVSRTNRAAIVRAQEAGLLVVLCTGRTWQESRAILEQLPPLELGVFATGAMVNRTDSGQMLDIAMMHPDVAHRTVELMADLPQAVLVLRNMHVVGHEYLVTGSGEIGEHLRWWFEHAGCPFHIQPNVQREDLTHTLRVSVMTSADLATSAEDRLRRALGDQVLIEQIQAAANPLGDSQLLSVYAAGVDKWRGLSWVARQRGIFPEQIAVIGDEVNDVSMLASAGCGIAMANAIDSVKAVADHVTLRNDEDGVAHAIDRLLTGEWV